MKTLFLLFLSSQAHAASITKSYTFYDGSVASASEMNTNFDQLFTESNSQDTRITALEANPSSQWTTSGTMIYYNGGNVGIGTATPSAALSFPNGSTGIMLANTAAATETFNLRWVGNVAEISTGWNGGGNSRSIQFGTANANFLVNGGTAGGLYQFTQGNGLASVDGTVFSGTWTANGAGANNIVSISPTITQTGTASYRALLVNPTENSVGTGDSYLADFQVGGVSKMAVTNTGAVGLNKALPLARLHVKQAAATDDYLRLENSAGTGAPLVIDQWNIFHIGDGALTVGWDSNISTWAYSGPTWQNTYITSGFSGAVARDIVLRPASTGKVGISDDTPSFMLDVNGTIRGFGITDSSDLRLKKDVRDLGASLEKILRLRGVSYRWLDSTKDQDAQIGLIAQELEKEFPELVEQDNEGIKSVNYSHLVAPLLEAVKELAEQNKRLKDYLCAKDPAAPLCK